MNSPRPTRRLLITPGEPAGIGPDITLNIAMQDVDAELLVLADPDLLEQRAGLLDVDISLNLVSSTSDHVGAHRAGTLNVIPVRLEAASQPGRLNRANSQYVLECLDIAARQCLNGLADAVVTGPVHKGIINDAGINFTGHTEYLANIGNSKPVMMLATDELRVALATTHLPLRDVSDSINRDLLEYIVHTLHNFLKTRCAIEKPRIAVCGLNPHAGEGGHLGREEIEILIPSIESCSLDGIDIIGPLPADTAFTQPYLQHADAILAMYHDQGLPVLKHNGFGKAVNITLGLPFIRTSVDHGTALELAGSGRADASSMRSAINMAVSLAANGPAN